MDTLDRLTKTGEDIRVLLDGREWEEQDKETLERAMGQIEGQWLTKVENIGMLLKSWEYDTGIVSEEIKRLQGRKKQIESKSGWLAEYCKFNMLERGEKKLQFPLVTVSVANNPLSVEIIDQKLVPEKYVTIRTEEYVDKRQILKDYKEEKTEVPGVRIISDRTRLEVK